jgi:hypothetical protein
MFLYLGIRCGSYRSKGISRNLSLPAAEGIPIVLSTIKNRSKHMLTNVRCLVKNGM